MSRSNNNNSNSSCSYSDCFLCAIRSSEPEAFTKQAAFFRELFKELPCSVAVLDEAKSDGTTAAHHKISLIRGLWSTAMAHPDDSLFVELGILQSMTQIIYKGLKNRHRWLSQTHHSVFLPYYAAHIIGSYTMNVETHAAEAVRCRAVPALAALARGALTWVEQRVAVRCLSHLASYDVSFPAVAASGILRLLVDVARHAADIVYEQFAGRPVEQRLGYHRELLTRGAGQGAGAEDRKAEEWASQLQCWSLQVLNCFALREEYVAAICRPEFLVELPGMWGGLMNGNSPAGVGLLRTLCYHKLGRIAVASCPSVVEALCNVARSSDDWQYMAVDCLLWLLQDPNTRAKVLNKAVVTLADLVELTSLGEQKKPGELIMEAVLLQQQDDLLEDENVMAVVEEVVRLKKKMKIEKHMTREDIKITQAAALVLRLEGNARFSVGDVRNAATKYSEALEVCPIKAKKDRIIILNNRAQCYLLMGEPEKAVSDTTRAVCLCKSSRSLGRHGLSSSLWRRAQAYDMLGLPKESLLDALVFGCTSSSASSCSSVSAVWENGDDDNWDNCSRGSSHGGGGGGGLNFYVARLVRKQMRKTWLFREVARRMSLEEQQQQQQHEENEAEREEEEDGDDGDDNQENDEDSEWETASGDDAGSTQQQQQQQQERYDFRKWKR